LKRRDLLASQLAKCGISLPADALDRLLWFLDELLRWNRRVNLTAITDPAAGIEKHLVDSLTLLPLLGEEERLLDLGSGGGFPGIPLKIALPRLRVLSVDAVQKKIAFQRHVVRHLGLEGFEAHHGRVEQLSRQPGCGAAFDVVVSRAFTSLSAFAALALPFLAAEGRIVAMKGAEGERELTAARPQLEEMGLVCTGVRHLQLPDSWAERTLILLRRKQSL
jgi:16S rRNA (guanine527-N7)-methyltransferase